MLGKPLDVPRSANIPVRSRHIRDLTGKAGAEMLAAEIEEFWHGRGYPQVHAWVETGPVIHKTTHIYTVRTNLVNGLPPSKTRD